MIYDLLIVGSGSAGVAAALEASQQGAQVAVIESNVLGGTCVNVGCVPSKALLWEAEALHQAGHHPFAGIHTQALGVDLGALQGAHRDLIEGLRRAKYQEVLEAAGVPWIKGRARFIDEATLDVEGEILKAEHYILAPGAAPAIPQIPGLAESRPWTYVEALAIPSIPRRLVVLGGGAVGLELAQAYARLGARVSVLEAASRLLLAEDPELTELLREILEAEGLEIRTGIQVERVEPGEEIRVVTNQGSWEAEAILVATGRLPRTAGLGLEAAGVERGPRGELRVDPSLRTSNPRIFAAGDAAGLPQYVYVAAASGRVAARNALGAQELLDLRGVPRVTFTTPSLASVGLREEEARRSDPNIRVARLSLHEVPRAITQREERGLFKLVVDQEGVVLGLSILAPGAGEALQEAILAVKYGLNYRDLIETFHPYLTLAEGIRLVAQALDTDVKRLSCCA